MKILFIDLMPSKAYTPKTPERQPLGGSQSAICYYVSELSKQGHELILVNGPGGVKEMIEEDGIKVYPHNWFFQQKNFLCDIIFICSATSQLTFDYLEKNYIYKLSVCWQGHYGFEPALFETERMIYKIDVFAFVSEYQRNNFCRLYGCPFEKTILMKNGISPHFLVQPIDKKSKSFIYFSNPQRGLATLPEIWKIITTVHSDATLKVFSSEKTYGKESDNDFTLKTFDELRKFKNVEVNESVGQEILARYVADSAFLLYPTHFVETSCIVCLESCAVGTIPIVSDMGVFPEYIDECVHYDNTFISRISQKAIEHLTQFDTDRSKYDNQSKTLSNNIRENNNYKSLSLSLIDECNRIINMKGFAISRLNDIQTTFNANSQLAVYVGESMPIFFEDSSKAALFFLRHGNHLMRSNYFKTAERYYSLSFNILPSISTIANIISYYEKVEKCDKIFEWYLKSLKIGFDLGLSKRILKHIKDFNLCEVYVYFNVIEIYFKHSKNIDEFLFYVDCMNILSRYYRTTLQQKRSNALLRDLLEQLNNFPCDLSKKREHMKCISTNLLFSSNYSDKDDCYLVDCLNYERYIPKLIEPYFNSGTPNTKIRIGILSGDFNNHPVTYILNGFIADIDTSKFEIYLFNQRQDGDLIQQAFRYTLNYATVINIDKLSVEDSVKVICEKNIDVLVDMCGHTSNSSVKLMDIIRAKPAKVICNYFAYPNTTGIWAIDFKLGDKFVLPASSKAIFTEEFQEIEGGMHCFKPILNVVYPKHKNDKTIIGIFNNPQKLTIEFLEVLSEILKKSPTCNVCFCYRVFKDKLLQEFYVQKLKQLGIASDRIQFYNFSSSDDLPKSYSKIDLCLDTFPYNGGTISIESLYYNTPYITLKGNDYVSLVGASILNQCGHDELIATSKQEYIDMAVKLSKDKELLHKYHSTLNNDVKRSSLGDGKIFAKKFEKAITEMLVKKAIKIPCFDEKIHKYIITNKHESQIVNETIISPHVSETYIDFFVEKNKIDAKESKEKLKQFIRHQKIWEDVLLNNSCEIVEITEHDISKSPLNLGGKDMIILNESPLHYVVRFSKIQELVNLKFDTFLKIFGTTHHKLQNYVITTS